MTQTCIILAGGLGTRMSQYTKKMPKALIPVAGKSFVHHQLDLMEQQGFERIIFSIGYLGDMIVDELTSHPHPNLTIEFIEDGDQLLGTGGAIRRIIEIANLDDFFFVTYGDSYLVVDPLMLIDVFDSKKFDALMTVYPNTDKLDTNNCHVNSDGSVRYIKNASNPETFMLDMVDFGISYISRASLMQVIRLGEVFDLAKYFETISMEGHLQGVIVPNRFYEIGSPTGRDALEMKISSEIRTHE